jgi:hypothetical protein
MWNIDNYLVSFVLASFLFQVILIVHFAFRKWRFILALRFGWIVYALSIPAAFLSLLLLRKGMQWFYWLGGFIYLVWAAYGYIIDYIKGIDWRNSLRWPILVPYVILYLSTTMFFWWPMALIFKPLWYVYAVLFIISTFLNVTSHKSARRLLSVD